MRRMLLLYPLAVACLIALPIHAAQSRSPQPANDELEALELQLHAMLGQLTDVDGARPVFREHGKNHFSLTVRLSARELREFSKRAARAKDPQLLAVGQQVTLPTRPSRVSNPVLVSNRSPLNFWWAFYNPTDTDVVSETRLTVKGAGVTFLSRTEDLTYEAGSITLHWEGKNVALQKAGVYTNRVKVSGAGSRKTKFVVQ